MGNAIKYKRIMSSPGGGGGGTTLTQDQIDAINNSSAPDASNPFATIADIPSAQDLNDVLTTGNASNIPIVSVNGKSEVLYDGNSVGMTFTDGAFNGQINVNPTALATTWNNGTQNGGLTVDVSESNIAHSVQINLNSPIYKFNQLTATRVPYIDASKQLVVSAVTPTELGYISGVTSSVQTQISTNSINIAQIQKSINTFNYNNFS